MSHAWTHSWCRSPSRDEAVRAAEDGRPGPLPTLEEAIQQAFGFDDASVQRACDETKTWPADIQAYAKQSLSDLLEQGVPRRQALAEASRWGKRLLEARYPAMIPKTGSATSAPEHENKGERMATKSEIQAAAYRAEAAERITQAMTADRFSAAVAEADTLRARVEELESERDGLKVDVRALMDVGHRLGSQVKSLESQLESVADRAAAAETALENAPAARGAAGTGWLTAEERGVVERVRDHLFDSSQLEFTDIVALDHLLARSSPPQVVAPASYAVSEQQPPRDLEWRAALAAAGVTVKEVGRE